MLIVGEGEGVEEMSVGTMIRAAALGTTIAGMTAGGCAYPKPKEEGLLICKPEVTLALGKQIRNRFAVKEARIREAAGAMPEESVIVRVKVDVDPHGGAKAARAIASYGHCDSCKDVKGIADSALRSLALPEGNACTQDISIVLMRRNSRQKP